jgi:hypothetical protein
MVSFIPGGGLIPVCEWPAVLCVRNIMIIFETHHDATLESQQKCIE